MTTLEVSVLPVDTRTDVELDELLASCPTSFAQQTRHWRNVITGLGVDTPLFLGCRSAGRLVGVLPAYRFEGPLGAILTSAAQAGSLGGVTVRAGEEEEPIYAGLIRAFIALAEERGCAVASVISNPIWPDVGWYERFFEADFSLENSCLVLDLDEALGADGEIVGASSNLRRNLRRARSGALSIDETQSRENVDTWYEIHRARHTEIGATVLPKGLFVGALDHMVPNGTGRFFFVRETDSGDMVAGGLYVAHEDVIDALMPSMRTDTAKLAPNFLLAMHSITWARSNGIRYYNWQASPPQGGVDRFKRQWGSRDHVYCYFSRITGDVSRILSSDPAELSRAYPWHYVLPFDQLGAAGSSSTASTRASAWKARESAH
ncbi:MAG: GNAT family N-acetyltransferase [Myxococcota bacterium]